MDSRISPRTSPGTFQPNRSSDRPSLRTWRPPAASEFAWGYPPDPVGTSETLQKPPLQVQGNWVELEGWVGREPKTPNRGRTQRSCPEPNGTSQLPRLWEALLRLLFLERTERSECRSPGFCSTCSRSSPTALLRRGGGRGSGLGSNSPRPERRGQRASWTDLIAEMAPFFLVLEKEPPWSSSSYPRAFFTLGQGS